MQRGLRVPDSTGWDLITGQAGNAEDFAAQALKLVTTRKPD